VRAALTSHCRRATGNARKTLAERCVRTLRDVYSGQLATAAVADMPVGWPPPFVAAPEQAPGGTRISGPGLWLDRAERLAYSERETPTVMHLNEEDLRQQPTDR